MQALCTSLTCKFEDLFKYYTSEEGTVICIVNARGNFKRRSHSPTPCGHWDVALALNNYNSLGEEAASSVTGRREETAITVTTGNTCPLPAFTGSSDWSVPTSQSASSICNSFIKIGPLRIYLHNWFLRVIITRRPVVSCPGPVIIRGRNAKL